MYTPGTGFMKLLRTAMMSVMVNDTVFLHKLTFTQTHDAK